MRLDVTVIKSLRWQMQKSGFDFTDFMWLIVVSVDAIKKKKVHLVMLRNSKQ